MPEEEILESQRKYSNIDHNHFIKEGALTINTKDGDISLIKWTLRILNLVILLFLVVTMTSLNSSLNNRIAESSRYFTFMSTYRIPMILGNNYYRYILHLGN